MTVTKETFTCLLSFRFHSNVGVVKMWDWPKAKFLASLDCVPRGVFLSKGLFLSIKDSVRIWPGMEERPVALVVTNPPANAGDRDAVSIPELGGIPWRRTQQPTPVFLPGESHGQRSLGAMVHRVTESWTIKKAEHQKIDTFELWCWRKLLRVPWTARRSNQSILKEINSEYSLEGLMLKLKL